MLAGAQGDDEEPDPLAGVLPEEALGLDVGAHGGI